MLIINYYFRYELGQFRQQDYLSIKTCIQYGKAKGSRTINHLASQVLNSQ